MQKTKNRPGDRTNFYRTFEREKRERKERERKEREKREREKREREKREREKERTDRKTDRDKHTFARERREGFP